MKNHVHVRAAKAAAFGLLLALPAGLAVGVAAWLFDHAVDFWAIVTIVTTVLTVASVVLGVIAGKLYYRYLKSCY